MQKEIVIICESYFLNNSSGINTFVRNLIILLDKIQCDTDIKSITLISDNINNLYFFKNQINDYNININYYAIDVESKYKMTTNHHNYFMHFNESLDLFLCDIKDNIKYIFISNSSLTTKLIINRINEIKKYNSVFYSYTHIGDIFDLNKKDVHDFKIDEVTEYLKILSSDISKQHITILTQTQCMKNRLYDLTKHPNINVIEEPLYLNFDSYLPFPKTEDILVIAGNYKRKRYDKMIRLIKLANKPFKIIVGNKKKIYDIEQLIKDNNITQEFQILEELENSFVYNHICQSKMLLHVSDIEVCPYSVLEAASIIPTVINNNNYWSDSFKNICEVIDVDDDEIFLKVINDIYNNKISTKFNYIEYVDMFTNKWKNIL